MKAAAKKFIESLTDLVIRVEDYWVFERKVSISELILFGILAGWLIWFAIFDIKNSSAVFANLKSEMFWVVVISVLLTIHLLGGIYKNLLVRLITCFLYALFWFIWFFIGLTARASSPFVPTIFALLVMSCFLCVRLLDEYRRRDF